jgi:hypothetical protein
MVSVKMRNSIALLGLATSVQALESSVSRCAESTIHHATMISTKPFTATLTSIPIHINTALGQGDEHSSMTTVTQEYVPPGSGSTARSSSGILSTKTAISNSSLIAVSNGVTPQKSASAFAPQSLTPSASGADDQSSSQHSLSTLSAITVGGSPTPQWITQSRYNPPPSMATVAATNTGNLTSPKSSMIAFTGSSSTTTTTSGPLIIAFLFITVLL